VHPEIGVGGAELARPAQGRVGQRPQRQGEKLRVHRSSFRGHARTVARQCTTQAAPAERIAWSPWSSLGYFAAVVVAVLAVALVVVNRRDA